MGEVLQGWLADRCRKACGEGRAGHARKLSERLDRPVACWLVVNRRERFTHLRIHEAAQPAEVSRRAAAPMAERLDEQDLQ